MGNRSPLPIISVFATAVFFSAPVFPGSAELDEAIALLREMHADQCRQQTLRSQVMVAHRAHDQKALDEVYPKLDALNRRLKPSEDRMKTLKTAINRDPDDRGAFEAAMLEVSECD
jgi:hypothetical protein